MPTKAKHSPLPWRIRRDPLNPNPRIMGADGALITVVSSGQYFAKPTEANTALIVRAVNSHAALVHAAAMVLAEFQINGMDEDGHWVQFADKLRAALKLAEGE